MTKIKVIAQARTGPSLESTVVTVEDGDIDAWANSILENLPRLKSQTSSIVTIPRVPERLRLGENDAYEPKIISFGPYHHGEEKLEAMEKHKWSHLEKILSRNQEIPLKYYINEIKEQEEVIRSCYSGHFVMNSKDFVEMMLIDACFIVEHLLQIHENVVDDELFSSMKCVCDLILYDILLLENQLPFFILDGIFDMAITQSSSIDTDSYPSSFTLLAIDYLNNLTDEKSNLPPPESIQHLLHIYHSFCLYTLNEEENRSSTIKIGGGDDELVSNTNNEEFFLTIPSATALEEAGIEFMRKDVEGSKLDVTFSKGKMMIPPLLINSFTKTKFRNLIAFEQFSLGTGSELYKNFTAYADFIASIVRTHKDVALLYDKGIILHTLGSHIEVADILCHVNRGACSPADNYVIDIYKEVMSTFTSFSLMTTPRKVSMRKRREEIDGVCYAQFPSSNQSHLHREVLRLDGYQVIIEGDSVLVCSSHV
ncbi:UPF0481 protein [Cinnamomum micranthum f. kanehirae]|uniref:UPF0481 protein n=1 Tax=Cinnamomum micranthum f. kanehirae TaxID=337451 RepID=A0A443PBP2_9MAGN|nr:UPF0481 protein [Cinnamomum micranthum f. kanehirae]